MFTSSSFFPLLLLLLSTSQVYCASLAKFHLLLLLSTAQVFCWS